MSDKALSAKQLRALSALLTVGSVDRAAMLCHVSKRSIFRWLHEPAFRQALDAAADNAIDEAMRMLADASGSAVLTLRSTLNEPLAKTSDKTRAANAILARLLQIKELHELQARVQKLEDIVTAEGHLK